MMKGLVEAVILVAITVGASIIIVNTVAPIINEGKTTQALTEAKNSLATIDQEVQQMMMEAVGSRRQIDLNIRDGKLIVAGDEEKIKIRLEGYKLLNPGTTVQEGNIQIRGGGAVETVQEDINNDGKLELVMKNTGIIFAIKKIGSPTNWSAIDTANIISQVTELNTNTTIVPGSGIFINDKPGSSLGTGYTTLTSRENNPSGSILVFVNSTAGISYEALFTLAPGMDYVELEIKNVKGL